MKNEKKKLTWVFILQNYIQKLKILPFVGTFHKAYKLLFLRSEYYIYMKGPSSIKAAVVASSFHIF